MKSLAKKGLVCLTLLLAAAAASAAPTIYATTLSGLNEAAPNASPGFGAAAVSFDPDAHLLIVNVAYAGLTGNTTAAHIHCCTTVENTGTAGVATQTPTFVGFPTGMFGAYSQSFDTSLASSWNSAYVTSNGGIPGAEAALWAGLNSGQAYLNIHSEAFPGGEIRGFLLAPIPEPGEWAMLLVGIPAVLAWRRRKA